MMEQSRSRNIDLYARDFVPPHPALSPRKRGDITWFGEKPGARPTSSAIDASPTKDGHAIEAPSSALPRIAEH
jgi:hypothetical protein